MGEIGKILRTHKHTHAAKLVVRIKDTLLDQTPLKKLLLQFVP